MFAAMETRWLLWLVIGCVPVSRGMCPQGFGSGNSFPSEWKIPKWPEDMALEEAAKLRTVTLGGFKIDALNEEYLEGPNDDFKMQGRETYWQSSGQYFMYYCQRFRKWRIAALSAFGNNMDGQCYAFVSDAHPGRDIRNETHIKGWIEVENGQWVLREQAGVVEIGKLGDQMDLETEEENPDCDSDAEGEGESEGKDAPFGKKDKSNCPVMPVVRKARDKVVEATKAAGKWVRRLFPKVLGAPEEEDAIPDVGEEDIRSEGDADVATVDPLECDPKTQARCSYKQKFFIEKQVKRTPEDRKQELLRLSGMKDVVMKPEQADWLKQRVSILKRMVANDVEVEERTETGEHTKASKSEL